MDLEKSSIERLKRTLYSRNENIVPKEKRTPVALHEIEAPTNWGAAPTFDLPPEETMTRKNNPFFNRFLIGSLIFFSISLLVALFVFFGGVNMISSNNLDIKIIAPTSTASGEELNIGLSVENANRTDLEEVSLFIDYPEGSEKIGDEKNTTRERVDLGTIAKGESSDYSVRAVLFGEKDSIKTFNFRLEYKVKGSNAVFSKEKALEVIIGSSPILFNIIYPKEVNSGQVVTLSLEVTSNSSMPMKNVLVKAEYPYGFTYKESNIKPLRDNSIWNIGDLKDGDKKTLTIKGTLLGQNLEDRTFTFSAGTESPDGAKDFETPLIADLATIGIRKSFFDLVVNSSSGGVARLGDSIPTSVSWTNTLPDKILNSRIEIKISGNIFDRNRVSVSDNGFYRSQDSVIAWDKNSTSLLETILPGETGDVSFSIASLASSLQTRSIKNPYINLHVTMTGDRSGRDSETISSEEDLIIKIGSEMSLSAKSYRNIGPFNNIGPIPPKADRETTYTVTWLVTNTTNNLKDAVIFTTLPAGIVWKAETSPASEKISFNPDTRIVSWEIDNVVAGAGFVNSPKTVSFKVGLTPSTNQIGTVPQLTGDIDSEVLDTYTEKLIKINIPPVTTRFADPSFISGNENVVK